MTRTQLILARLAMVPILVAAAWNSYFHTVHVASAYGQDNISAHMLPLSVDGLMLIGSLIYSSATSRRSAWIARITLALGFGASFTANMLATNGGLVAHVISGWYAISLLLGAELLQHTNRRAMTIRQSDAEVEAAALKAKRQESARKGLETKARNRAAKATTIRKTTRPRTTLTAVEAA